MTLQWGTPSSPTFSSDPFSWPTITVNATRTFSGHPIYFNFKLEVDFHTDEFPLPTQSDVLGWLETIKTAMENDGWDSVSFSQETGVTRQLEEVL